MVTHFQEFFVWVEVSQPGQQFFSHVGKFSWVDPILSNEDEVSCSGTHHAPDRPCDQRVRHSTKLTVLLIFKSESSDLQRFDMTPVSKPS